MSRVVCQGLSKSFGTTKVIEDLHLEIPDGAIITVLGASGSGKTTLLRLIAGLERPDAGTIHIDDDLVDSPRRFVPPEKRHIGYVAQEGNLFPHLTVAKNIAFGLSRHERRNKRVEELLTLVGLEDFSRRYPHQLSGGEQQRVALARTLAPHPNVVLLDEPFSSLDAGLRLSLRFDVMRILRDQHVTTILVTHDQEEALSIADLVGIMQGGRVRQFATPETLYAHPADVTVAEFLGEANLIPGTAIGRSVDTWLGRLQLATNTDIDGPAVVLVRPEQISLQPVSGPATSMPATGRVIHRQYYGHDCVLLIDGGEGQPPIRVRCPGPSQIEIGANVSMEVRGDVVAWDTHLS